MEFQIKTRLARNLVLARHVTKLTQQELAKRAQVSRATVAQLESGGGDPRLSTLCQLGVALGVSPVLLMLGDEFGEVAHSPACCREAVTDDNMRQARKLVRTGIRSNVNKAASLGVETVKNKGMLKGRDARAATVGAAIGTVLPSVGAIAGATIGTLLSSARFGNK